MTKPAAVEESLQDFLTGLPQIDLIDAIWSELLGADVDWLRAKPAATIATELLARCSQEDLIARLLSIYPGHRERIAALTVGSNYLRAGALNWGALLRRPPETPALWSDVLGAIPRGPAIDAFLLPADLVLRAANAYPGVAVPIMTAGQRVLSTLSPVQRRSPQLYVTTAADLSSPAVVPPSTYWSQAFSNACVKGPRMLSALILTMAPDPWTGLEDDLSEFLSNLSI